MIVRKSMLTGQPHPIKMLWENEKDNSVLYRSLKRNAPIVYVCKHGSLRSLMYFLSVCSYSQNKICKCIHMAICFQHEEILMCLLPLVSRMGEHACHILKTAASTDNSRIVDIIMSYFKFSQRDKDKALCEAVWFGATENIDHLVIMYDSDIRHKRYRPIRIACKSENERDIDRLVSLLRR